MLKIKKINNKKFTLYYCEKKFTNSKTLLSYIDKILVKKNSFISTGSVVKSNVEPYEIVEGNPAKKVGLLENK